MKTDNLSKIEIEIMLAMYEKFFQTIFEFDTRDELADYISERINLLDERLMKLNQTQ